MKLDTGFVMMSLIATKHLSGILYMVLALLAGALVIICISLNGQLAKKVGLLQSGLTNFLVGLLASTIYGSVIWGLLGKSLIAMPEKVPAYYFMGGLIGALIMVLNSMIILRLSAVYVTVLVFTGQLVAGQLIDYIRWHRISPGQVVGGLCIIIGLLIYMQGDKRKRSIEAQEKKAV